MIKKQKDKPYWEKKLDEVFSQYIRLKFSDSNGVCRCISCGKPFFWTDIQNGHYMSRVYRSTRFDENNCRPQCMPCNVFLHGNISKYRKALVEELGDEIVDMVETKAWSVTAKYTAYDYESMYHQYKAEVEKLKKEKGL